MSEHVGSVTRKKSSDFHGGIRFQSSFTIRWELEDKNVPKIDIICLEDSLKYRIMAIKTNNTSHEPRGKFDSSNQKHYPDLGSDASSGMEFQIQMSNVGCFLRLSPTHRFTNKDVPRDWLPWPWELGPTWNGAKCHHGLSLSPFHLSTRRYTSWMSQPSLRFKPGIHISYSRLVWIVMRTPLTCTLLLKSRLPVLKLGYTSN